MVGKLRKLSIMKNTNRRYFQSQFSNMTKPYKIAILASFEALCTWFFPDYRHMQIADTRKIKLTTI